MLLVGFHECSWLAHWNLLIREGIVGFAVEEPLPSRSRLQLEARALPELLIFKCVQSLNCHLCWVVIST